MKLCVKHWGTLKDRMKSKGLSHLIAANSAELKEKLEKSTEAEQYDPLIMGIGEITVRAIEDMGPAIMQTDYCPFCNMPADMAEDWFEGCTEDQRQKAASLGLLKQ